MRRAGRIAKYVKAATTDKTEERRIDQNKARYENEEECSNVLVEGTKQVMSIKSK